MRGCTWGRQHKGGGSYISPDPQRGSHLNRSLRSELSLRRKEGREGGKESEVGKERERDREREREREMPPLINSGLSSHICKM